MAAIDNAYTYYLTTYGNRTGTRYDAHKKSELRNVYNKIVEVNKESPLYKLKNEGDVAKFAIDIKEGAQHIRNVIASISGSDDIMKSLQKKIAVSSDEDIVEANYIGNDEDGERSEDFTIEVRELAKSQINIGNFLKSSQRDLTVDTYSFDLNTTASGYEFQFTVSPEDTNYSVQSKVASLITNANIGLTASVIEDASGNSALKIESLNTGIDESEEFLFKIDAGGSLNSTTALHTLGIDQVSQEAQNSSFLLNGSEHSSYSNTFSINNVFELQLKGISPKGEPAQVGFKPNAQSVMENITELTSAYNSIIKTASHYADSQEKSQKLLHQMSSAWDTYQEQFEAIGIYKNEDNQLTIDSDTLTEVIESEDPASQLSVLNDFKKALDQKASVAVLNPMDYVNKVVVAYKNPGKNFASPYISSLFSGLMLDHYC